MRLSPDPFWGLGQATPDYRHEVWRILKSSNAVTWNCRVTEFRYPVTSYFMKGRNFLQLPHTSLIWLNRTTSVCIPCPSLPVAYQPALLMQPRAHPSRQELCYCFFLLTPISHLSYHVDFFLQVINGPLLLGFSTGFIRRHRDTTTLQEWKCHNVIYDSKSACTPALQSYISLTMV